jgi:hypothetical protein
MLKLTVFVTLIEDTKLRKEGESLRGGLVIYTRCLSAPGLAEAVGGFGAGLSR